MQREGNSLANRVTRRHHRPEHAVHGHSQAKHALGSNKRSQFQTHLSFGFPDTFSRSHALPNSVESLGDSKYWWKPCGLAPSRQQRHFTLSDDVRTRFGADAPHVGGAAMWVLTDRQSSPIEVIGWSRRSRHAIPVHRSFNGAVGHLGGHEICGSSVR